jgi:hypothetical protein
MDLLEEGLKDPISHWYYKHKYNEIMHKILKYKSEFKTLSDIGSGSAVFSNKLSQDFPNSNFHLVDINYTPEQISKSTSKMNYTKEIQPADIFLLTDVLEHIEEPKEFFQQICKLGKNDDLIVITVPAFMQLWSGHDVFLKHYRRYTKSTLLLDLKGAPIEILDTKFLYQALFLPAYIYRKIFGREHSSQLKQSNRIFESAIDLVLRFERIANLKFPLGVSILLIARIKK